MQSTVSWIAPFRDPEPEPTRPPPSNTEAEQALLGAIFRNNLAHGRVADFLLPEHFSFAVHARIYDAICRLIDRGQIANPITLKNLFENDATLAEVGGAQYLTRLAESAVTIINAEDYGRRIHDLHLRRQLIGLGEDMANEAYEQDLDDPATGQIERAEQRLYDLAATGQAEGGFKKFDSALSVAIDMAQAAYNRGDRTVGVGTGFIDLDKKLGGLHPSDLIILAGRPGMGKTSLATNIAFNAAKAYVAGAARNGQKKAADGAVVGFFSLEMSSEQLATRILSEESRVSSDRIRRGDVRKDDFDRFVAVSQQLSTLPLYIDDTPAMSVAALRTRARRLKRQQGLDLIVIDYLQLMRPSNASRGPENRVQEISEITRGLKAIAKELEVPVRALSQLSRAVEQREDKRPQLADLRESGSIEQDADVVMFIFREEYYRREPILGENETQEKFNERHQQWVERMENIHGIAEVIVEKQRHGPTGTIRLQFEGEITKFSNHVDAENLPASH